MGRYYDDVLVHSGTRGMKWGIRTFQNYDGTRTQAGLEQEAAYRAKRAKKAARYEQKITKSEAKRERHKKNAKTLRKLVPPAERAAKWQSMLAKKDTKNINYWNKQRDKLVSDLSEEELNKGREELEIEEAAINSAVSVPVSMLKYYVVGTPMYFIDAGINFKNERERIKEKYE